MAVIEPVIHVVAAVVRDDAGRILLAQRAAGGHLAGLWEFPGGKREAGESPWQALVRELDEEIGIQASAGRPLIAAPFAYPGKRILLDVWQVDAYVGQPWSREGQALQWVELEALDNSIPMPAADRPAVAALRLPPRYLITPDWSPDRAVELREGILRSLGDGIRLIRLRVPQWPLQAQSELVASIRSDLDAHAALLLGSADIASAMDAGYDGVHLSARAAAAFDQRPIGRDQWLAVSCHSEQELQHASAIDADFVTLSPVLQTQTHPDASALGWATFNKLARGAAMPVYALGGMDESTLATAVANGAQGIAGIRGLWATA